jgi:hypothetical protein
MGKIAIHPLADYLHYIPIQKPADIKAGLFAVISLAGGFGENHLLLMIAVGSLLTASPAFASNKAFGSSRR